MTYIHVDPLSNEPSYYEKGETPPPNSEPLKGSWGSKRRQTPTGRKDRAEHLRVWLETLIPTPIGSKSRRELLSARAWCEAIGFDPGNFNRFLSGQRGLPEPHLSNLITIAEGFGYKPLSNEHNFL